MADDTRQHTQSQRKEDLSHDALTVDKTAKAFTGNQWSSSSVQPHQPPSNANLMPGGTEHTAGGKLPDVTLSSAVSSIKLEEFQSIHKKPCVRDSLMPGIGGGFALGGLRAIFGATIWSSCSWAVATFCGTSAVMYQYCQYRRQMEKDGMIRAMEILEKKDAERKAREAQKERVREARRKAKEEELEGKYKDARGESGSGRSWWKIW
ncbi:hypothetical protein K431DRAFT_288761 [Polychaeton citri CBS 116435]|uniref:Cytochrome c oxidase assembly protein COX20, mitochondrial n=1 Tax=Polychaeton citri CBS 116435 TaxID=1314669 RepID=A0A9P4Q388_9PEZI|nr:hypothetical protein K431DRAFT_288761 [Polychaeton citri CBS 116435]